MKYMKLALVFTILTVHLFGQISDLSETRFPVVKSALLPGWGEHDMNSSPRGFLFNGIEAGLWIFAGLAYTSAASHENDLFYCSGH